MPHRVLLVALVALLSSCSGKSRSLPQSEPTKGALGLVQAEQAAPAKHGPVAVTYYAPVGEAEGPVQIGVSFDRPMVALGTDTLADAGVFSIAPAVAGSARWVGSQTLLFEPSQPLPMATEFRVTVAKELRALDGNTLAEELSFLFATPALMVERTGPHDGAERQERALAHELFFNQTVTPAKVAEHVVLEVSGDKGGAKAHEFMVTRPDGGDLRRVRVVPKKPYPLGASVLLRVRAGLVGEEGVRPLAGDFVTRSTIHGPLRLLANPACKGNDCIAKLSLSNPVKRRALVAALRFEPPLARPLADEADYASDQLYFGSELAPNTSYRVSIEGELRDLHGNLLQGERSVIVKTPPLVASARLLVEGDLVTLAAAQVSRLRVQLQNLKDARVELSPLSADELAPLAVDAIKPRAKAIVTSLGSASPVERRVAEVELAPALAAGKGAMLVSLVAHGQAQELRERRLLAFTDLSVSLKAGSTSGLVWVTRLSNAEPVAGAKVRISRANGVVASGQSDARGLFRFELPPVGEEEDDDVAAVVEHEGDLSFTRKHAGVGPWELTDHAGYRGEGTTVAHLFTERGIYRPGDTLQLKGILRTQSARGLAPTGGEVELRVLDAEEREVERARVTLNDYGTFAYALRIPGSIALGPLTIRALSGGQTFETGAEVAEYKPAELEVTVRADRARAVRGEQVRAHVDGRFMFGAAAREARVFWSARYQPYRFASDDWPGFTFTDLLADERRDTEFALAGSGETQLDEHGARALEVALASAPVHGPSWLKLEASVLAHGAEAAASAAVEVWPASVLVGLRAARTVSESKRPLALALHALSSDGKPAEGALLDATFERRVYETGEVGGKLTTKQRHVRVGACHKKSKLEPVHCSFTPTEPGLHVARVRSKDAAGRVSRAAVPIYVYGQGAASWGDEPDARVLALQPERSRYQLGETARVLVPSPFADAQALVTVEREGVLSVEQVRVGRAGTIEVKVDERFVPNAFVSVLLLRPLAAEPESGLAYRVGTLELAADVSQRKLAVDVVPDAKEKRPGDEVHVRLLVRDGAGRPTQAELTVYAVDEGVLALTAYQTPDPFGVLYAPRALSVWTADGRGSLATLDAAAGEDKGGDEGGGGGDGRSLRSNFASVALFAPHVETDGEGRAELRFKLPDATTRYRIMAVAAAKGAEVGAGSAAVLTRKPLLMRPLLPRLLRAGDSLQAGVAVHNDQSSAIDAEVALEVVGVTLLEGAKKRVHIAAGQARELFFAVRADRVGEARFTFSARAGSERDGVVQARRVQSPSALETVSGAGETLQTRREALAPLTDVRRDVGGLTVQLSTSALSALEAPARSLLAYEYGCTEQLASRLIAAASLERLRRPLALADESLAPLAQKLASELERHQGTGGAFGLWRADDLPNDELSAFLTAYALLALDELRRAGIAISSHASDTAKRHLAAYLRSELKRESEALHLATQTFVVYALARTGSHDPAYAGKLFEQRAALPPFARVELAHALGFDPESRPRVETLLSELSGYVRVTGDEAHLETNAGDGYAQLFVSDVRATAETLLFLLAHAPEHVLLPKLARWLSMARERDGTWGSTQASAWGLTALAAYLEKRETRAPNMTASARLGERALGEAKLSGHKAQASFHLPMRDLPATGERLLLDKRGAGTLHYVLRLAYAQQEPRQAPSERGFFVERSYERIEPAALARGANAGKAGLSAQLGDYVRVTLRIAVPSTRRFVLITDPLPAGLEPVDLSLATVAQGAVSALRTKAPYDHYELRDDRAVFAVNELPPGLYAYTYLARASSAGEFSAPPARAEEMYHPETHGMTPAHSFRVSAP
jgi:alpha-2-macroglobulin